MNAPDGMEVFLKYHRRMLAGMAGACLGIAAVLCAALSPDWTWAGGFAAGAAAQLFKFGLLDVAAIREIGVKKESAAFIQLRMMVFSLLVFGAAVAVVFWLGLRVWAMAAGIFMPRLILLADAYIRPNPFGDGQSAECSENEEREVSERAPNGF